jgi:hypothetical protein
MTDRTNPFDIQWERDHAAEAITEEAKAKLEEDKELARERKQRLVPLSGDFYYDPKEKLILKKEGSQFKLLDHERKRVNGTAAQVKNDALEQGYKAVSGGFYWNEKTRQLYVRQGERYVLYALDRRRKAVPKRRKDDRRGKKRQVSG